MQVIIFEGSRFRVVTTDLNAIRLDDGNGNLIEYPVSTYADSDMNKYIRCVWREFPGDILINEALSKHGESMR